MPQTGAIHSLNNIAGIIRAFDSIGNRQADNIKITVPEDLQLAAGYLQQQEA